MTTSTIGVVNLSIGGMTCLSCVARVERALRAVPGVLSARVDLGYAAVVYDARQTNRLDLTEVIRAAGYEPLAASEPGSQEAGRAEDRAATPDVTGPSVRAAMPRTPAQRARLPAPAWGLIGMMALLLLYAGIVGGASRSFAHVLELLATDWPFVAAIALGFGVQVGLYAYLRSLAQAAPAGGAATGMGTGTSTVAMIACCAHHATDILPVLGLSAVVGATSFLAEWRVPLMTLGIAMNLVGIALSLRLVRRAQRHLAAASAGVACHQTSGQPSVASGQSPPRPRIG